MWVDLIIGASIFGFSGLLALIFNKGIFPLVLRFAHWTPTDLDGRLLLSIKFPFTLLLLMLGAYLGRKRARGVERRGNRTSWTRLPCQWGFFWGPWPWVR